jgi:hypothetical protein
MCLTFVGLRVGWILFTDSVFLKRFSQALIV